MAKVTLLTHTPMPEQTIAAAAKLCYSAAEIDKIYEGLTPEKTASFVEMLSEIGHESPIEHASFTFGIEGVSRSFLAQVTRHRMASFSVQSQRYVKENMFEYVLPPEIESVPEAREEYSRAMEEDQAHYDSLTAILKEKHKKTFLAEGRPEKEANRLAEKKAIEDARFVLPNACNTKMICTMNARSLMNFFTAGLRRGAKAIPERGTVLRKRGVLRGKNVLRKNAGGPGAVRGHEGAVPWQGVS